MSSDISLHACAGDVARITVEVPCMYEPWLYSEESRHHLPSRRQLQLVSTLCEVFLALVWGVSLAVPPILNWKQPVHLVKKDVIAAIENIARSNVPIVYYDEFADTF